MKRSLKKRVHSLGFIKGGVCDRLHRARSSREGGALRAVHMLFDQKDRCLQEVEKEKYVVINYPKWNWKKYCRLWGGDSEIGVHRFLQNVLPLLIEQKRIVTYKFLQKLAKQIASFEFGFETSEPNNPLSILEGKCKPVYYEPHVDYIYKKRFGGK